MTGPIIYKMYVRFLSPEGFCCSRMGVPAELGSFQLYDIVHALKNLGPYRGKLRKLLLGFRFLLLKRRVSSNSSPWALQVTAALPAVPNPATLPLSFLLWEFPVQLKPLGMRLHFALGGKRIWGDHQRWCKALTKNVVLIFTGQGCKCTWRKALAEGNNSPYLGQWWSLACWALVSSAEADAQCSQVILPMW